ncbi:MAG: sulfatase-like hydrolase/transferase, partial [Planctomycetota bacterium]
LSGRFPTRFGYEFNPIGAKNEEPGIGMPASEKLLSEQLHDLGYSTALIGKWHLGGSAAYHPQRHGFDEFFGFTHEGHYFVPPPWKGTTTMLRRKALPASATGSRYQVSDALIYTSHMGGNEPDYDANNPIVRIGQPVQEDEYLTDALARESCDFIERFQSSPFLLCVTFNAVHSPLQAKNSTLEKFASIEDIHRRIFAAMLSDLDSAVGRITAKLDECGIRENTLVVFLSDNGGPTKELTSSNLPLRDGKGSMYDGGLRVPFIFNWPNALPAGEVCGQVVSSLDILPTCLEIAGGKPAKAIDGQNVLPMLQDPSQLLADRVLFWRQGNRAALRDGDWKIVANDRKLQPGSDRRWELYNIAYDIAESRNLAEQEPNRLRDLLEKWQTLDDRMLEAAF